MRDSDSEYPLRQPQRREHHPFDDDADDDTLQEEPRYAGGPLHQRVAPTRPQIPPGHIRKTLIIGLVAGIIAALQVIIFTFANASLYQNAANAGNANSLTLGAASTIVGIFCLTSFISLVIYFIAGFIIGKVAIERRMGFLGGFVAGAVAYAIGFFIQYFPGYPGSRNTGFSGGLIGFGGGLITALIILLLLALLGGLFGFLGAWLATRKHPYYVGYDA